jgi:hypothetical protein
MTAGYIPLPAAAEYLGRSPRWLRRRVALKQIKFYRPIDSQLSFTREDLDAFMAQFAHEPIRPVTPAARPDLDEILGPVTPRRRRAAR